MINNMYIYTKQDVQEVVAIKVFVNSDKSSEGDKALIYRKELQKKLKTPIVAWALMGGENEMPEFNIPKF